METTDLFTQTIKSHPLWTEIEQHYFFKGKDETYLQTVFQDLTERIILIIAQEVSTSIPQNELNDFKNTTSNLQSKTLANIKNLQSNFTPQQLQDISTNAINKILATYLNIISQKK